MSGNAQDSGSPLRGRMGRLGNMADATTLVKKGLTSVGGSFTRGMESIISKPVGFQNKMTARDASVYSKGVRELDRYGYEKYNIGAEGSEIFISMTSDKVSFNDGDPMMVRGTDGNYVGNADVNWVDHSQEEVVKDPVDAFSLFGNAARGSSVPQEYTARIGVNNKGEIVPSVDFSRMVRPKKVEIKTESAETDESMDVNRQQMDLSFLKNMPSSKNIKSVQSGHSIILDDNVPETVEESSVIITGGEIITDVVEESVETTTGIYTEIYESNTPVKESTEVASTEGFVENSMESAIEEHVESEDIEEYVEINDFETSVMESVDVESDVRYVEVPAVVGFTEAPSVYEAPIEEVVEEIHIEEVDISAGSQIEESIQIRGCVIGLPDYVESQDDVQITEIVEEPVIEIVEEHVEATVEAVPEVAFDDTEIVARITEEIIADCIIDFITASIIESEAIVEAFQLIAEQKAIEENIKAVPANMAVIDGAIKVETSGSVAEVRSPAVAIDADGENFRPLTDPKTIRRRSRSSFKFDADGKLVTTGPREEPKEELRSPLE